MMFLFMGNKRLTETDCVQTALNNVAALLPSTWHLETSASASDTKDQPHMTASIIGPMGDRADFAVTYRPVGTPVRTLLAILRDRSGSRRLPQLFISEYIGPTLRSALTDAAISFTDTTGWVSLVSESPLILLSTEGAIRAPASRRSETVERLNGVAANRIINTLCTRNTPFGVRELAGWARVSPGSVSKLLPTLAAEGIIDRGHRGRVVRVNRKALIERWVQDYSFTKTNRSVTFCLAPRGLARLQDQIANFDIPVTATGSAAARQLLPGHVTPVLPMRLLALYAESPVETATTLNLILTDAATANVVIASPQDSNILDEENAPVASILVDLLTLPGRGDAEADQLIKVLAEHDPAWGTRQ